MQIILDPIAFVKNSRSQPPDDYWGSVITEIELASHIPEEAFLGIEEFSHLHIIYQFHLAEKKDAVFSGRPRGNPAYPQTGIFAQRKKDRPNGLGLTTVELLEHKGRSVFVKNLDAIDGTPVLDIKPVMKEFEVKGNIRQPEWSTDLMKNYWK